MFENSTSNVTELNKVQEVLLRPSCLQPSSETRGAEIPRGWDVLAAQCVGPGVRMPLEQECLTPGRATNAPDKASDA